MVGIHNCTSVGHSLDSSSGGFLANSSPAYPSTIVYIIFAGALGSLFLCISLLVFAVIMLLRRRRVSKEPSPFDKASVKERGPQNPRLAQSPPPSYNRSASAKQPNKSKRHPAKHDFAIKPYILHREPSMATFTSHRRTNVGHISNDSLQFSQPATRDSFQFGEAFPGVSGGLHRRSSVDAVVALEAGDRSSPDRRSIEARPSSSTFAAEERMLAKMERMIRPEWNASSSYQ
ncbi:hypothetical protein BDY19DRAFT_996490 [Irpex rosettiformis]|uniref:Uncharacterized protein n=1 Tax=Irpex rosettiformis TaxID=378272 RepID=A0ACB8TUS8_9APHY|nr:hypothetical protein BDY19DRAFT_996490 [Irpex rosettiformis]